MEPVIFKNNGIDLLEGVESSLEIGHVGLHVMLSQWN